jgi:hypothetical protein
MQVHFGREIIPKDWRMAETLNGRVKITRVSVFHEERRTKVSIAEV